MPKYLFIATNEWVEWGGSEALWGQAAERLARRGAEVRVSIKWWDKPVKEVECLRAAGCRILHRRPFSLLSRMARKVLPLPEYVHKHVQSAANAVDLVVISQSSFLESMPWIMAVRAAGVRYAIIVQGAAEILWPADDNAEKLSEGFESAARAYLVSEANLDLLRQQLSAPLRNGRVIRNPFKVRYDARPPWPEPFSGRLSLACVARLDIMQKGQDILLNVLSLPHWRNRDVQLALVGNGPNQRSLRRMVEIARLPNIEFTGFVDDIEALWSRHHALMLPSRFEGMPLALVEAMLCGRPAILTDVAGHRELVRDGVNGFLAKAPTVELVDEAMNRAWESRDRLREMGAQAASDVRQCVSSDPIEDFVRDLTTLVDCTNQTKGWPGS